jgi:hypothetical protein
MRHAFASRPHPFMPISLYGELIRLVEEFNRRNIPYAIIGGLAVAYHARPRATDDLDFLFLARDIGLIREAVRKTGYLIEATPWTFQNAKLTVHRFSRFEGYEHMVVDVMVSDEERYAKIVEHAEIAQTAAGQIRFATKEHLIWLKKIRNSPQDRVDIAAIEDAQRGPNAKESQ